jgi:hypothetical protein
MQGLGGFFEGRIYTSRLEVFFQTTFCFRMTLTIGFAYAFCKLVTLSLHNHYEIKKITSERVLCRRV